VLLVFIVHQISHFTIHFMETPVQRAFGREKKCGGRGAIAESWR
jgi:hypothetical protein